MLWEPSALAGSAGLTAATGGDAISADTAGGTWTALSGPALAETSNGGISPGTIVLNAPTGFEFDTAATVTATVTGTGGSAANDLQLASNTATVTASTITITVATVSKGGRKSTITWTGISVRLTAGSCGPNGCISKSGTSGYTENGATACPGTGANNYGTLAKVNGVVSKVIFGQQPTNTATNTTISPAVTVQATDRCDAIIPGSGSRDITVALTSPGSASLSGTPTITSDTSGLASFGDLKVDLSGTYTLTASSTSLTPAASSPFTIGLPFDHIHLESSGGGLTCQPTTITVKACADAGCTSLYTGGSVTATLSTTAGTWAANPITLTGSTTVNLSVTTPQTVTIGTTSGGVSPAPTSGTSCSPSCQIDFADTGFIFSTIPTQVAGVTSGSLTVQAVKKAGNSPNCVNLFNNQAVTLDMASQCVDPTTCAGRQITVGGIPIASNPASGIATYTSLAMSFDNTSTASFTLAYPDAGKMSLTARYALGGGSYMSGSSNSFVVKPYAFTLAASCADGTANGASQSSPSAADPKFCRAGKNFSIVATAVDQSGAATPNYGKEATPESLAVTWSRQLPAAGADGALPSGNPAFSGAGGVFGATTTYAWSWDEVGILKATAAVGDGDYLGAGNVSSTTYAGRFYPDHFDVVLTPQTPCTGFVYAGRAGTPTVTGQPFTVKASAMNGKATPGTTTNYDTSGGFAKSVDLSLAAGGGAGKLYVDTTQGGTGAIPSGKFAGGVGQVNYNDATGKISYVLDAFPTAPTAIGLHADDADTTPSTGTDGSTFARFGRLRLSNAFGSEKANLAVPVQAHYWSGNSWVINSGDSCTSLPANAFYLSGAAAGTGASAVAVAGGTGTLTLTKPTTPAPGSVDVAANLGTSGNDQSCLTSHGGAAASLPWLRSQNGNCAATYDRDPSARATFGIYAPETRKNVHVREQF